MSLQNEVAAALEKNQGNPPATEEEAAQDALSVIAAALVGIEKHLFALVYLEQTKDAEKTGVTFVRSIFDAIYDGSDPFLEVQEAIATAKDTQEKAEAGANAEAPKPA